MSPINRALLSMMMDRTPQLSVKFKDQHWFYKWRPLKMRNHATAAPYTIFLPDESWLDDPEKQELLTVILMHDYRHIRDIERLGRFVYYFMYWYPQFQLFSLAFATGAGAFMFLNSATWAMVMTIVIGLLGLVPWPSRPRRQLEYLGYRMNLFVYMQRSVSQEFDQSLMDGIADLMMTVKYWWPALSKDMIKKELYREVPAIIDSIEAEILSMYNRALDAEELAP